jgi:hypothetical protein
LPEKTNAKAGDAKAQRREKEDSEIQTREKAFLAAQIANKHTKTTIGSYLLFSFHL